MIKIFKYSNRIFRKIDISPLTKINGVKLFLYLFTGLSIIIFTGKDLSAREYFYKDQNGQTICNHTDKISSDDLIIENFESINPEGFIIFSSYFKTTTLSKPTKTPTGRSPPYKSFN